MRHDNQATLELQEDRRRLQARVAELEASRQELFQRMERLRQSEEILRLTLTNISDAVFVTEPDGQLVYVCPNVHVIFGFEAGEVHGMGTISRLLGDGLFDREALEARGEIRSIEHAARDSEGNRHLLLTHVKKVRFGRKQRLLYCCRDVTDLKRADAELRTARNQLEKRVEERTQELRTANRRLVDEIDRRQQVEARLQERERLYRLLADNATDMIALHTREGAYLYVSPSSRELFGYRPEELVGRDAYGFFHPDDTPEIRRAHEAVLAEPDVDRVRYRFRCKDGDYRWVEALGRSLPDGDGRDQARILTITRDVTERKAVEEALRKSEETARALLDAVLDSALLLDLDGTVLDINEIAARRVRTTVEKIRGKSAYDFLPPEVAVSRRAKLEEVVRSGRPVQFDDVRFGRTIRNSIQPILDAAGRVEQLAVFGSDITEAKAAEQALRESEARFRTIFESAGIGIALVDAEGKPVVSNPSLARILGFQGEELATMPFTEFTHPEDAERDWLLYRELVEGRRDLYRMEKRYIRKDGRVMWALLTVSAVRDPASRLLLAIGMVEDVTEAKLAALALEDKEKRLSEQARHLEEVNTALRVLLDRRREDEERVKGNMETSIQRLVLPYVEKLEALGPDAESRTYLEIMRNNLEELVSPLVNSLTSSSLGLTPTEIQVVDLVRNGKTSKEIAQLMRVSPSAVSVHRYHIRRKLGLVHKKVNLRAHLQALQR